ncbi:ATP-binding protein [Fulvivirga sedimenti]|uniref:ATP-binding protein n=1 Tax=Fulvivirga sedimenti TaxID=2879465 RepID=A0A9X1L0H5_9BACT|nr:ATP-binding protein [Fulvivirga sedimenti]MCA6075519.1 ATP-binding protein [Fulvivirga sedimenti]MCA6076696.1 ATP-binding protein [Fulvivirga sedimenti]MCA6077824.1 ATP-binding protein [Fulvivirga sedimenti]
MTKGILTFCIFIAFITGCGNPDKQENQEEINNSEEITSEIDVPLSPSLTMVWETDTVLTTVESVLFDPGSEILYASNISGNPTEKDGIGFITKLSKSGDIIELEWVKGLNAPKGMAITGNRLYVTDIDALVEIELASGKIVNTYAVEGAEFLNDVTTHNGIIYFSDMSTGKVHSLENGMVDTVLEGLESINGLAIDTNGVLIGLDAEGLRRYAQEAPVMINDGVTGGDGLIVLDANTYIASRWQGEIYLIKDGHEYLLLDTKAQQANTADIGFIPDQNVILVPTFFKNKVVAYRLNY